MKKPLISAFLTAILIGGLVLANAMFFGMVGASTEELRLTPKVKV